MDKPSVDIGAEITRLESLALFELKSEWRRLHRSPPPMRLSRDLLMRGITYKIQERLQGGLSPSIARRLERLGAKDALDQRRVVPPISLKAGARLVREWRGVTHNVLVHDNGFEWKGRRFGSLTAIAQEITGAHWSGPRFFGLRKPGKHSVTRPENGDAKD